MDATAAAVANPQAKAPTCGCLCGENVNPRSIFRQGHDQRMIGELALRVAEGSLTNLWVERLQLPTEVDDNDIQERINLTSAAVAKFFSDALARKFTVAAHNRWDALVRKSQPKGARQPQVKVEKASESEERKFARASGLDLPKKSVEHPGTGETVDLAETGRKVTEQNRTAGAVKVPSAAAIASEIKNARMLERQAAEANSKEEYAVVLGAPIKVKVGRWEYDATIHGMSQAGKVTAVRYDSAGGKEIVKTEGQFTIVG